MQFHLFGSHRAGRAIAGALCAAQFLFVVAPAARAGATQGAPNRAAIKGDIKRAPGVFVTTFKLPAGTILVTLPDDVTPGDTVSATLRVEPAGRARSSQRQQNEEALRGYTVAFGTAPAQPAQTASEPTGAAAAAAGTTLAIFVPPTATPPDRYAPLVVRDEKGAEVGRADFTLAAARDAAPAAPALPTNGKAGQPLVVPGRFDGNATNTRVLIGGSAATILAESPRKVVVQTPTAPTGKTEIEVRDGDSTDVVRGPFQNDRQRRHRNGFLTALGIVAVVGIIAAIVIADAIGDSFENSFSFPGF
jgi:hypothetical protein